MIPSTPSNDPSGRARWARLGATPDSFRFEPEYLDPNDSRGPLRRDADAFYEAEVALSAFREERRWPEDIAVVQVKGPARWPSFLPVIELGMNLADDLVAATLRGTGVTGWELAQAPLRDRNGEARASHGVLLADEVLDGADWTELPGAGDGLGEGGYAKGVAAADELEGISTPQLRRRFGWLYVSPPAVERLRDASIPGLRLELVRYTSEVGLEVSGMTDEDFDALDFADDDEE